MEIKNNEGKGSMRTLVMKFGGTSTGSGEALHRSAEIVIAQIGEWDRIIVVVSAMEGVTNLLLECAESALSRDKDTFQFVIERLNSKLISVVHTLFSGWQYHEYLVGLLGARIEELRSICQHIQTRGTASPQELDEIAALGERINVHVFSAVLRKRGIRSEPVEASELIVTDDCFQAASPIKTLTDARIKAHLSPLLANSIIPVVTGFIGATPKGATTTLGRGGSDFTATILAESLHADEVWFWTDVDGVMTADPCRIPRARLIPEISYDEVYQLAYFGAKVLHPKTILPARDRGILLRVKNTFNPECLGTLISDYPLTEKHEVSAVTGLIDISLLTVRIKPGGEVNKIKTQISAALTKWGISPLADFQTKQSRLLSFVISRDKSSRAVQVFRGNRVLKSLGRTFCHPQVTDNLSLITVVGREIQYSPVVQSIISNIMEKSGANVNQIGNGASPNSLVYAVANRNGEDIMNQIHDEVLINGNLISQKPNLS
jgi:aspartate kinase